MIEADRRRTRLRGIAPALAAVFIAALIAGAPGAPADAPPPPPAAATCAALPTLLGVERAGNHVAVTGLAATSASGEPAKVQALLGAKLLGRAVTTTIRRSGGFQASMPLPNRSQRPRVSYRATIDGVRTASRKLERDIEIVSRTKEAAGTRIIGQLSAPGRRAITILRRACGATRMRQTTGHTTSSGRFEVLLQRPTAPDTLAIYRASTMIDGTRRFSVDIAVRR